MSRCNRSLRALLYAVALAQISSRVTADDSLEPYRSESDILATTPSTDDGAIAALFNPAQWAVPEHGELAFWWSDEEIRPNALDSWGFSVGHGLGLSARRRDFRTAGGRGHITDYQVGLAFGARGAYHGVALGFSGGDEQAAGRASFVALGGIHRPCRWLSFGDATRIVLGDGDLSTVADVGIRPLGSSRVTLFADYALTHRDRWDEGTIAGGVEVRPIDGLSASVKWDDEDRFRFSVGVTAVRTGVRVVGRDEEDTSRRGARRDDRSTRTIVRLNPPLRDLPLRALLARKSGPRNVLSLDLNAQVVYQSHRFGDSGSLPLRAITCQIDLAIDDPSVGGVALNLSGLRANGEMVWEIREKLLELKRADKRIVVYTDRLDMSAYYLASVADRILLDPQGAVGLTGLQLSRTYHKEMLAKMGIGFDEWRFLEYKSAMETFSRTSMSEADRRQRQAIVDDAYEELAAGIAASGRLSRATLDSLVDNDPFIQASRALELGLVDRLGSWDDVDAAADTVANRNVRLASHRALARAGEQPDETWGAPPIIALVYAIGECEMDSGIKGRATSKAMRALGKRRGVKAVVLRADSPGGDVLPSDLVARATKEIRKSKKPVIVSQGRVAASGGYWISMDADSIFASPFTVTGSIGVIGGWFWNDGLGTKLGLSADHVQRGRSADLLGGLRLPILGATIPERNFDERERELAKRSVLTMYDDFTDRVAAGRRLDAAYVREIAEGRVYMGRAAIEKKIVDRIGTLDEAIAAAKKAAGIPEGRRVEIVEYPKRPFLRLPNLLSSPLAKLGLGLGSLVGLAPLDEAPVPATAATYEDLWLAQIFKSPGKPMLLMPSALLPDEEAATR